MESRFINEEVMSNLEGRAPNALQAQLQETNANVAEIVSFLESFRGYYDSKIEELEGKIREESDRQVNVATLQGSRLDHFNARLTKFQAALKVFFFVTVGAVATTIGMGAAIWMTK
jgi:hypothetical protein